MRDLDSLDLVELMMMLEEGNFGELSEKQASLIKQIACPVKEFAWQTPDDSRDWPAKVVVFGKQENRVLFHTQVEQLFGMGCLSKATVVNVRLYQSLSRALFAFPEHHCRN